MIWLTILLSLTFLSGLFFLFPVLATLIYKSEHDSKDLSKSSLQTIRSLDILIPCHNEHGRLKTTLRAVSVAVAQAHLLFPDIKIQITVGLDACTDESLSDTLGFDVKIRNFDFKSKWKVLCELTANSNADWIAFVDAGCAWDSRLLRNAIPYFMMRQVMCVAPRYHVPGSGLAARVFWTIEAWLKTLENRSGGPVSVHGATTFYRRRELIQALNLLAGRTWINDDVVIPMTLHMTCPQAKILYARNRLAGFSVFDFAPRNSKFENIARARIAHGNLQWINHLLPLVWQWNQRTFLIAMRRVCRLFWSLVPLGFLLSFNLWMADLSRAHGVWQPLGVSLVVSALGLFILMRRPTFLASIRALQSLWGMKKASEEELKWS
jgi:hypothetical protein